VKIRSVIAVVVAGVVLSACSTGPQLAGSAAIVEGNVIPQSLVTAKVNEVRAELEQLPTGAVSTIPSLALLSEMVLDHLVLKQVLNKGLAQQNITISKAQVEAFKQSIFAQYGEEKIRNQVMSMNGISSVEIDNFMEMILAENLLAKLLAPTAVSADQSNAMVKYLGDVSRTMNIRLSPRFGEWNPNKLQADGGDITLSQPALASVPKQ
jgi:hypothetical protein